MAGNPKNNITLKEVDEFITTEVEKRSSFKRFDTWLEHENNILSKNAERDGNKDIPDSGATRMQNSELLIESNFKAKLIELLNPGLILLNQIYDGPVRNLTGLLKNTSGKEREIEIEENKIEKQIQQENDKLEAEKVKFNEQINDLEVEITDIKNRFDAKVSTIGRDKPKRWNKFMCWAGIVILALVEVPLNSKVFEFFRLNRIETYITSGILIFAFPILSHFTGRALHKNSTGKPNYKAAIPIFAFIVVLCFFINLFRVDYISQVSQEVTTGEGPGFINLISTTSFWMAFLINLTMFVSAIIISYHTHDPDFEFESIYNEYTGKTPKLQAEIEQVQDDMAGAEKVHRKKLNLLEAERAEILRRIEELHARKHNELNDYKMAHDTIFQYMQNLQEYVNQKFHASLRLYRSHNEIFRKQPSPSYWENDIADIPDLLEERGIRELNLDDDSPFTSAALNGPPTTAATAKEETAAVPASSIKPVDPSESLLEEEATPPDQNNSKSQSQDISETPDLNENPETIHGDQSTS